MSTPEPKLPLPSDDIQRLFASDTSGTAGAPFELPTIPADSPLMKSLHRDLQSAADAAPPGSPLRTLVNDILQGKVDLRAALADPAFPRPDADRVDPSLRRLITELEEENPR